MEDFDRESKVAAVTLAKRFGGWKRALESAGFDPSKARYTHSDLDLLEELRRVAALIGRTPTTTEFDEHSSTGASTISQRLGGTWRTACESAGLAPVPRRLPPSRGGWNKGQRKINIAADELRYLYETEGLSAAAIGTRLAASRQTVLRLLQENGIAIKRLHYSMPRATSIEESIYLELERREVPFVRQQVIDGLWVADALIPGARIVIECDGEYWHSRPELVERDRRKDRYLQSRGYRVLRFPEAAIKADVRACVQKVVDTLVGTYSRK